MTSLEIILTIVFTVFALGFFIFALVSWKENHQAALIGALFSFTLMLLAFALVTHCENPNHAYCSDRR